MINDRYDVKIGHWITFRSTYNGKLSRKFYRVVRITDTEFLCCTRGNERTDTMFYDTVIDNLFECQDHEVYATLEECADVYPEDFV